MSLGLTILRVQLCCCPGCSERENSREKLFNKIGKVYFEMKISDYKRIFVTLKWWKGFQTSAISFSICFALIFIWNLIESGRASRTRPLCENYKLIVGAQPDEINDAKN